MSQWHKWQKTSPINCFNLYFQDSSCAVSEVQILELMHLSQKGKLSKQDYTTTPKHKGISEVG